MAGKYEYHKQNDYPGERIAERERVADRREAADKRADARVAAKGRTEELKADNRVAAKGRRDDTLMDAQRQRSTDRAERVNRKRDSADTVGLVVIAGLIVILLAGSVWGYMAMQKQSGEIDAQSNEIDSLNLQLTNAREEREVRYDTVQLSDDAKQVQLHKDFVVLTNDVKKEVTDLENYNLIYSDMYQLCSGFAERENNINHALYRFAEKKIVYYEQIAVLADKPECKSRIETMRSAMVSSKFADEKVYVLTKNLCHDVTNNPNADHTISKVGWSMALDDAKNKAKSFDDAEQKVIECFD
ncbi:MAG: hypothetical protein PHV16_03295 [Candidatus Nanoarchaeia archaeon]|nr:hypothetical protein [Candidatus Nanoarchaeia archaeon]